jgi:hypothetical protein
VSRFVFFIEQNTSSTEWTIDLHPHCGGSVYNLSSTTRAQRHTAQRRLQLVATSSDLDDARAAPLILQHQEQTAK